MEASAINPYYDPGIWEKVLFALESAHILISTDGWLAILETSNGAENML